MPELPEVANYALVARRAIGKRIESADLRRPKILGGVSHGRLEAFLKDQRFTDTRRHGKFLFLRLSGGKWLGLHFGLSGLLSYSLRPKAEEGGVMDVLFEDGSRLRYRGLFGRVDVLEKPEDFIRRLSLGPDAMAVSFERFKSILTERRKTPVKSVFMDQKNLAGVGNLYSDEALFRARIHPLTHAGDLDPREIKRLYDELRRVLAAVTKQRAKGEWVFPKNYLASRRGAEGRCPRCGAALGMLLIGGRSAYFCPKEQPKP
ncbi:MAG TPA: DNA-formamidopyrimidine glycosylase family protein [Candidatus Eisenbacteria bacterium]|nr:DNA-formamidopyrimidine glycosylase family protein [Candidatus Eisenbacteria bacterium]